MIFQNTLHPCKFDDYEQWKNPSCLGYILHSCLGIIS